MQYKHHGHIYLILFVDYIFRMTEAIYEYKLRLFWYSKNLFNKLRSSGEGSAAQWVSNKNQNSDQLMIEFDLNS